MLWEILIACVNICIGLYLWLTWNYGYWKKYDIPFIKPKLCFGNVKDVLLLKKSPGEVYREFYMQYPDEAAVGIYNLRQPELVLCDLDLIKTVLIKEFSSFHDNAFSAIESDLFSSVNPFVAKGDRWKMLRSIHTQAHTVNKIRGMFPLMTEVCEEMNKFINENLEKPIEGKYFSGQFTTDVVASCVYGLKTNSFTNPDAEFRKISGKLFKQDFFSLLSLMLYITLPGLTKFLNLKFYSKEITDFFKKIVKDLYEHRKQNNITGNDFLQTFLDDYMNSEKPKYSLEEIAAHTLTFFVDGYETSSSTIAFALYLLALHPDVQERLREEIKDAEKKDYDTIHELKYLNAVVNETFRLYPPGLVLHRVCTKETVLKTEQRTYPINEGISISVPLYGIFRDPKHYSDPMAFDPNRFYDVPEPPSFFPFGLGPRACFGSRFGLTQIKVVLTHIVENFKIIPKDEDAKMPEINPHSAIVITPPSGLWIKFEDLQ